MKWVMRVILIAIFCMFSCTAFATNWRYVCSDVENTMLVYIDTDSRNIYPTNGWVKKVYVDDITRQLYINQMRSIIWTVDWSEFLYDCVLIEYETDMYGLYERMLYIEYYDNQGNLIYFSKLPGNWKFVNSGTLNESIYFALLYY